MLYDNANERPEADDRVACHLLSPPYFLERCDDFTTTSFFFPSLLSEEQRHPHTHKTTQPNDILPTIFETFLHFCARVPIIGVVVVEFQVVPSAVQRCCSVRRRVDTFLRYSDDICMYDVAAQLEGFRFYKLGLMGENKLLHPRRLGPPTPSQHPSTR